MERFTFRECRSLASICIPSSVEVLCYACFRGCDSLSSLIFESDSKLTRIEGEVFSGCVALKSISIPQSIRSLVKNWKHESSLSKVIFESGASLLTMIETGQVDLGGIVDIYVQRWDGVITFPGYSVCIVSHVNDSVRLLKA
jgi:hypothetical protein